jgi:hypothetical protein
MLHPARSLFAGGINIMTSALVLLNDGVNTFALLQQANWKSCSCWASWSSLSRVRIETENLWLRVGYYVNNDYSGYNPGVGGYSKSTGYNVGDHETNIGR